MDGTKDVHITADDKIIREERPTWFGEMTWYFEHESDQWMDGYVHATDGRTYLTEEEDHCYFAEHLGDLVFIHVELMG